jgi:hypothetical protein
LVEQRTENPCVAGSNPAGTTKKLKVTVSNQKLKGAIAQLVEQRTENPCVAGSNPAGTTTKTESNSF